MTSLLRRRLGATPTTDHKVESLQTTPVEKTEVPTENKEVNIADSFISSVEQMTIEEIAGESKPASVETTSTHSSLRRHLGSINKPSTSTVETLTQAPQELSEVEFSPEHDLAPVEQNVFKDDPFADLIDHSTEVIESEQITEDKNDESQSETVDYIVDNPNAEKEKQDKDTMTEILDKATYNLANVEKIISSVNAVDVNRQLQQLKSLQERKQKVESDLMRLSVQKEQAEKDLKAFEEEIRQIEGVETIEDYAKYLLDSLQANDLALRKADLEISEAEDKIEEIKLSLQKISE